MPHIKTYCRFDHTRLDDRPWQLSWLLLTSANMSKVQRRSKQQHVPFLLLTVCCLVRSSSLAIQAAWGELQRQGTQLAIRSYELGVFFGPGSLSPGTGAETGQFCVAVLTM